MKRYLKWMLKTRSLFYKLIMLFALVYPFYIHNVVQVELEHTIDQVLIMTIMVGFSIGIHLQPYTIYKRLKRLNMLDND